MQRTTDTDAKVVNLNAQTSSQSHPATPIAPLNKAEEPAVDVKEKASVPLPTGGLEGRNQFQRRVLGLMGLSLMRRSSEEALTYDSNGSNL